MPDSIEKSDEDKTKIEPQNEKASASSGQVSGSNDTEKSEAIKDGKQSDEHDDRKVSAIDWKLDRGDEADTRGDSKPIAKEENVDNGEMKETQPGSPKMPSPPEMKSVPTEASEATRSTPGAFAIEGYASRERNSTTDIESPVLNAEVSMCQTETGPSQITTNSTSDVDIPGAYLVEESHVQGEATIVKTWCGIDAKSVVIIAVLGIVMLIAIVLGVNPNRGVGSESIPSCGPLCGTDGDVPIPEATFSGISCEDWNFASLLPDDQDSSSCASTYGAASYACSCPNVEIPTNGCGGLCSSGENLPDPDKIVTDVFGTSMTCEEWELMSKFDTTTADKCANYNAVGVLCGCEENVPPPDACGSLCADNVLPNPSLVAWGMTCEEWNAMSTFLPPWQDSNETCSEIYQDIAYRCECPEVELPPDECNTLCQERSLCGASMCQDESPIPDPDKIVRGMACKEWSFFSRMTDYEEICYFYEMVGAECGCNNKPPPDTCGPLCGEGQEIIDPVREVRGQRCDEWNSMSIFLGEGYLHQMRGSTNSMQSSCDAYLSPLAFGCGCPTSEPPENGCGYLCQNGLPVPEPERIVGDQTCEDLELRSLFETDPNMCYRYTTIVSKQCGCVDVNDAEYIDETEYWSQLQCFSTDNLNEKSFSFTSGMSQYSISFGENGSFLQVQNQASNIVVGKFSGFETNDNDGSFQASYGGGYRCGLYGPRRGSVVLVQDEDVVVPEISSVIEPSICVYRAILHVPPFCES